MGHFFKRSTICRHDIDVRWLSGHSATECNLLPIGRPLGPGDVHGGGSERKPFRPVHLAAPQSSVRITYICNPLPILRKLLLNGGYPRKIRQELLRLGIVTHLFAKGSALNSKKLLPIPARYR